MEAGESMRALRRRVNPRDRYQHVGLELNTWHRMDKRVYPWVINTAEMRISVLRIQMSSSTPPASKATSTIGLRTAANARLNAQLRLNHICILPKEGEWHACSSDLTKSSTS